MTCIFVSKGEYLRLQHYKRLYLDSLGKKKAGKTLQSAGHLSQPYVSSLNADEIFTKEERDQAAKEAKAEIAGAASSSSSSPHLPSGVQQGFGAADKSDSGEEAAKDGHCGTTSAIVEAMILCLPCDLQRAARNLTDELITCSQFSILEFGKVEIKGEKIGPLGECLRFALAPRGERRYKENLERRLHKFTSFLRSSGLGAYIRGEGLTEDGRREVVGQSARFSAANVIATVPTPKADDGTNRAFADRAEEIDLAAEEMQQPAKIARAIKRPKKDWYVIV